MEGKRRPDEVVVFVVVEASKAARRMVSWSASRANSSCRSTCSALFHLTVAASSVPAGAILLVFIGFFLTILVTRRGRCRDMDGCGALLLDGDDAVEKACTEP